MKRLFNKKNLRVLAVTASVGMIAGFVYAAWTTNGSGSATQWRPCTPAMAAGWTDHVWSVREMLLFRVPPWPQPAGL